MQTTVTISPTQTETRQHLPTTKSGRVFLSLPGATDYDKLVEIFNFDGNAYTFDPPNCISVSCDRYIQVSSIHLSST